MTHQNFCLSVQQLKAAVNIKALLSHMLAAR